MVHGELHLAAVLSVALGVVPGVLAAWHREHPRVDVVLHEYADLASFARALTDATADVAIGPLPEGWEGPHHPLDAEEFVALVPPGDPLAGRVSVRLEQLAERPWVQYGPTHALSATVELLCSEAGFTPHAAIRSTRTAAVPRLVAAGVGVGLVPANALTPDFPGTALRLTPRRRRPLAVLTRPGPHPLIAEFVATTRRHARLTPDHLAERLA
ncbi:LysR family transcriptional regulator substrate-binding protein [Streptomyces sp. NRRL B-1347]|uniref:LysR family transcriptional regulator substrate-binding protein n=1 Tax=Streptomyces sp. NRRL B-1347 TaxID=1476877 RepID=UPI00068FC590|nr:LysR family transcriptional regulator substrate-binding protein [Streptomyces sp. NRRL B-1347]